MAHRQAQPTCSGEVLQTLLATHAQSGESGRLQISCPTHGGRQALHLIYPTALMHLKPVCYRPLYRYRHRLRSAHITLAWYQREPLGLDVEDGPFARLFAADVRSSLGR